MTLYTCVCVCSVQVINFSSGEVGHGQRDYTKRVGFSVAMPSANLSIYINNTQESDTGRYICNVIIPGEPGLTGEVHLNVKGKATRRQRNFKRSDLIRTVSSADHTFLWIWENPAGVNAEHILKDFLGLDQSVKNHIFMSKHRTNKTHLLFRDSLASEVIMSSSGSRWKFFFFAIWLLPWEISMSLTVD